MLDPSGHPFTLVIPTTGREIFTVLATSQHARHKTENIKAAIITILYRHHGFFGPLLQSSASSNRS
jgi:hypothetical protein